MLFTVILATLALASLSASQHSTDLPFILPGRVNSTTGQFCPPEEVRVSERNEIDEDIRDLLHTVVPSLCQASLTQSSLAVSCSSLPTACSSGYYWSRSSNGSAVQVYCDMDRVCGCSGSGGWTRVAFLNMTDPDQQCPGAWILANYNRNMRLCGTDGYIFSGTPRGCFSAMYSTYGISYSRVCGRVRGYQYSAPNAFYTSNSSIDSYYLSGVSLTHGPPGARQHIWTFAAGYGEGNTGSYGCPCADRSFALAYVPSFVRNDFFCESGNPRARSTSPLLYTDPLWDGQGCASPPCCELSYPPGMTAPWFCKQLPQTTTDDIEARICRNNIHGNEDTPVELVELYIR